MVLRQLKIMAEQPSYQWSAAARIYVLEGLRADDAETKALATELAGDLIVMDDEVAGVLLEIIEDDGAPTELRATAAISLGPALEEADLALVDEDDDEEDSSALSPDMFERVATVLEKVHKDEGAPDLLRRRALEAAVRAPEPWHAEVVGAHLEDADPEWRLTAMFCAGYVNGFEREVLAALDAGDPRLRREAMRAAGMKELRLAGPTLLACASDRSEDCELRLVAIEALTYVDVPGRATVLRSLVDDPDEDVAEAAYTALHEASALSGLQEDDLLDDMPPD